MKVLIIGAGGFIGSHLGYFFEQQHDVFRCSTQILGHQNSYLIRDAEKDFSTLLASENFDLCINASGSATVGYSIKHVKQDHFLNVTLIHYLLESLKHVSPHTKLIHLSSAAVYGQTSQATISETHATHPYSPYGKHKLEAEQLCQSYDLPIVHCRAFSVYGVGLRKQLFWDIYQKSLHDPFIECYGTGEESRDYIYIDDLFQAIQIIAENCPFQQDLINIGNSQSISTREAVTQFLNTLNCQKTLVFNDQQRRGDPQHYCADITKLRGLGYQPQITFEEGLQRYASWLEKI